MAFHMCNIKLKKPLFGPFSMHLWVLSGQGGQNEINIYSPNHKQPAHMHINDLSHKKPICVR